MQAHIQPYETPTSSYLRSTEIAYSTSNFPPIDCIFVINLDRRPERWEKTKKLCDKQNLVVNRFSAIDGWTLSDLDVKKLMGNYEIRLRKGTIGCLLSHVSILKEAYNRGYNTIWIMEDDVEFLGDIHTISPLLKTLTKIDPNWDVFYTDIEGKDANGNRIPSLGSDFRPDDFGHFPLSYYLKRRVVSKGIMRIGQRFGAHSFILSRKGIEKILHYFTHVYIYSPIDVDMHYIPGIRQYSAMEDIVSVCHAPSDNEIPPPKIQP
jgi:GR25 family glycosyltransferase involved in LPS biosynthesis